MRVCKVLSREVSGWPDEALQTSRKGSMAVPVPGWLQ